MWNRTSVAVRTGALAMLSLLFAPRTEATAFGTVRGVVHDAQHRPVAGATARLEAHTSEYKQETQTNSQGEFRFDAVPLGNYTVTLLAQSFVPASEILVVSSGSAPVLHFQL